MAALVLFAAFVIAATAVHVAGQQGQSGFLSIDCGLGAGFSRRDTYTDITYVSDGPYVDGGEDHMIAADQVMSGTFDDLSLQTLRSFPSGAGQRNCYTLPTESGAKYLVRLEFFHGNYDGKNSPSLVQFDLHLGTNFWETVENVTGWWWSEAVFAAWASWVPVCLINTGSGTPFVNTLVLRQLGASLYPDVNTDQPMSTFVRRNLGASVFTQFPFDPYDRYWWGRTRSDWANSSTQSTIVHQDQDSFEVPTRVLQTAVTVLGNETELNVFAWNAYKPSLMFRVFLHFADFQKGQLRQFNVHINDEQLDDYIPKYLTATSVQNSGWSKTTDGIYNISLAATNISVLPPIINAYEIYLLIPNETSRTFSNDFDAMMAIKLEYGVKKNWMGDPCFPATYRWDGVKCSNSTGNTTRIISLDLSNSKLNGSISDNFTLVTELQFLDLSGNMMNGKIPDSLCKRNAGSLILRYESDKDMCNQTITPSPSPTPSPTPSPSPSPSIIRTIIIAISVAVAMVVLM